jgi:hypothetical protein
MHKKYVICINNAGYGASLELRKIYETIKDAAAEKLGLVNVIDESGEAYLYSKEMFVGVNLSSVVKERLETIS